MYSLFSIAINQSMYFQYCVATVVPDVLMSWGGGSEPAAQATLMSIGSLGVAENKQHAKLLYDIVNKELQIPPDR